MRDRKLTQCIQTEFAFLKSDYGMSELLESEELAHYCNESCMIGIGYDSRSGLFWVYLAERCPDSKGPDRPVSLSHLVGYRHGFLLPLYFKREYAFSPRRHTRWLAHEQARLVRAYAGDMLRGDFAEIEQIRNYAAQIRARDLELARQHNREIEQRYARENPIAFTDLYTFVDPMHELYG